MIANRRMSGGIQHGGSVGVLWPFRPRKSDGRGATIVDFIVGRFVITVGACFRQLLSGPIPAAPQQPID
jgi:hypothetical protein